MEEENIGTTGVLVDLFEKELTQEEWNALCTIHRLGARLGVGIRFALMNFQISTELNSKLSYTPCYVYSTDNLVET